MSSERAWQAAGSQLAHEASHCTFVAAAASATISLLLPLRMEAYGLAMGVLVVVAAPIATGVIHDEWRWLTSVSQDYVGGDHAKARVEK